MACYDHHVEQLEQLKRPSKSKHREYSAIESECMIFNNNSCSIIITSLSSSQTTSNFSIIKAAFKYLRLSLKGGSGLGMSQGYFCLTFICQPSPFKRDRLLFLVLNFLLSFFFFTLPLKKNVHYFSSKLGNFGHLYYTSQSLRPSLF